MTPFSARLTFLGLILLAGAISANALYMQPAAEREPAPEQRDEAANNPGRTADRGEKLPAKKEPLAEQRRSEGRATRADAPEPERNRPQRATGSLEPLRREPRARVGQPDFSPEIVRAIQRELWHRDYPIDRRDGRLDMPTRLAILLYEYESRLPLTGRPSEALLERILFGPFRGAGKEDWRPRLEADRALVAGAQRVLSRLGFANLDANGLLGRETRDALREFAVFRDLRPTGRLTPRLLLELADVSEDPIIKSSQGERSESARF